MSSSLINTALKARLLKQALLCCCLLLVITLESKAQSVQESVPALALGVPVEREMKGGETHAFRVSLAKGQFLHLVLEQQGIDVVVKIFAPDGQEIIQKDSPNGLRGQESVSIVAQAQGDYKIEASAAQTMPPGSYVLKVTELQEPTAENLTRAAADTAFAEGQKLRRKATAESRTKAIEKYQAALALWRAVGDVREEAYTLCVIGKTYKALSTKSSSKLAEAADNLKKASALLHDAGDRVGQAFMLNELGIAYRDLSDTATAIEFFNQARALSRDAADQWGEAQALNNIGLIYARTGYQQKALETYEQSLSLWQTLRDRYNEANTLNNLAGALDELGESAQALEYFKRVIKVAQELKDKRLEAYAHNNIGLIYDTWAESQAALDEYEQSLALFQTLKDARQEEEAMARDNLGMVYVGLGDMPKAFEFFTQSLALREQLPEPQANKAKTLTDFGYAYALEGNYQEALRYYERALPLSRAAQDRKFEAYALACAGMAYTSAGEPQKSLDYFKQALDIQLEIGDKLGQAITLDKMGQAYARMDKAAEALSSYDQALTLWHAVGDKQGEASSLYGLASLERQRNNLPEARDRIEQAISIIESLRTNMTSHQLRLMYLSAKHDFYGLYIEIRMQLYERDHAEADVEAALLASERGRARNLVDLLNEAHADVRRGIAPQLLDEERRLERELTAHSESLIRLRSLQREADAAAVETRLAALSEDYERLQTKIRATSKAYSAIKQPHLLGAKEIQQQLSDDNTLLLEYALGEQHSYLWAVSRTNIYSYTLPGRAEIEQGALDLRAVLTAYEPQRGDDSSSYSDRVSKAAPQYRQRAAELSRLLLRPVAAQLGKKRLVIVPDGALQLIPFEALPEPDSPPDQRLLVEKNEITYLPSATALALIRNFPRRTTRRSVAMFADPVFSERDERLLAANRRQATPTSGQLRSNKLTQALRDIDNPGNGFKLERLPYALTEAKKAMSLVPAGSGLMAVSFAANRAAVMNPRLADYRIVHFATHGLINDNHPELSGIVLSMVNRQGKPEDGFLQLHDIYNLQLPVDLVVLSACRTGIGKQIRGEGLVGLTRGFMYAGAARVIVSLWKVDDEATAALMERFYWHLIKERMTPSAALQSAKMDIMRKREQWRAPFYWAGFVLLGEWR